MDKKKHKLSQLMTPCSLILLILPTTQVLRNNTFENSNHVNVARRTGYSLCYSSLPLIFIEYKSLVCFPSGGFSFMFTQ